MINNIIAKNITRFVVLVLLQVLVFNNIDFSGYINPYIYIVFILLFPVNSNRLAFLILSFILGLVIDIFLDSGGVHAGASVFVAYARPIFLKSSFGTLYEHQVVKFGSMDASNLLLYIALMVVTHHLVLFMLEIFNIFEILLILQKTLFSSIATIILAALFILLFKTNK